MKPFPFVDQLLKRHFFKPQAAQSLSLFRLLYCTSLIWKLSGEGPTHFAAFGATPWYPIPLFELFHIPLMSLELFQTLHYVLLAALALTALGIFTRVSATVAWISFFLYMGTYLGFGKSPHTSYVIHSHNIVVFLLFILSFSPGVACYGFDGWLRRGWRWPIAPAERLVTAWPSQLIKLTLGLAYFGAGYCKVASHPLWADGYTLQAYLMSKHLLIDCEPGAWVAQHWWLCLLLGIGTLVLELTFFLIVFYPRLTWFYVFGAFCFHGSIYLTMKINFFPYYGSTFLIFLDWPTLLFLATPLRFLFSKIRTVFAGSRGSAELVPAMCDLPVILGDTRAARCIILGLWGLLAVCVYARIESWPFTDYRVFAARNHLRDVRVYRLAATDAEGQVRWIPHGLVPLSPTALNRRVDAHLRSGEFAAVSRMLEDFSTHVTRHDQTDQYKSLFVIERTLHVDPTTHRLEVLDCPLQPEILPATRAPIEVASRDGKTRRN